MANFTPPSSAVPQPDETTGRDDAGNLKKSFSWKGPYADLETAGKGIAKGDVVATGWVASSWSVRRTPGNYGVLTVECTPPDPTSGSGTEEDPTVVEPLKDIWSIKSVRNDVSIMAYCGSGENEPNRALIEAWMKEPDGKLAKKHQFKQTDGEIVQLTDDAATMDLVQKIEKGIEAVIRFYPVVTRTRTYADCPPACLEKVGFVDVPPAPAGTAKQPTGLENVVSLYSWLKVQDDALEQPDGKWTRVESWMGIPAVDGSGWDSDLYGTAESTQRWPMPYNHQRDTVNPET